METNTLTPEAHNLGDFNVKYSSTPEKEGSKYFDVKVSMPGKVFEYVQVGDATDSDVLGLLEELDSRDYNISLDTLV